jgi:hypothetical protein
VCHMHSHVISNTPLHLDSHRNKFLSSLPPQSELDLGHARLLDWIYSSKMRPQQACLCCELSRICVEKICYNVCVCELQAGKKMKN